jgi:hypothetical protein
MGIFFAASGFTGVVMFFGDLRALALDSMTD